MTCEIRCETEWRPAPKGASNREVNSRLFRANDALHNVNESTAIRSYDYQEEPQASKMGEGRADRERAEAIETLLRRSWTFR